MSRPPGTPPARTLPGCHSGGPPPGAFSRSLGGPPPPGPSLPGRAAGVPPRVRGGHAPHGGVRTPCPLRPRAWTHIGLLLCRTQPGRQGGFILRGGDRRPQAVLDGRGLGVLREEAGFRVAVGAGHRRAPCRVEEARQGQADRAQTLFRRDHRRRVSLTRKVSTLCRDWWSVGVMSSSPPAVTLRKPQASQPALECSVAGVEVASM